MTSDSIASPFPMPEQSPLFHASQSARYERQHLIQAYEERFDCRLVVLVDTIFPHSVTLFEDLIYDASPDVDLHLLLQSPGGDGETAVRLVRAAQARCKELTVIVPDQAKSAATLLAIGAHHILMSPMSDLGPIDPQFFLGEDLVAAKDIIAAYDDADQKVRDTPETYAWYVSLLSSVDALIVQQSRSELDRTEDLLLEALRSNPDRNEEVVTEMCDRLKEPLIMRPRTHAALFSVQNAKEASLPAENADLQGEQWQMLWRLWTKYYALGAVERSVRIYEGRRASWVLGLKQ